MGKSVPNLICCLVLMCALLSCGAEKTDILIKGALVFDGSGAAPLVKDIGITGDKITYIGNSEEDQVKAATVIEAAGLYLAPGFIDPHTHTERLLSAKDKNSRANLPYLAQGVTTVFAGNDGAGPWPIGEQLAEWERNGIGTNVGLFVGQGTIRETVVGVQDVEPSADQMGAMRNMVSRAMEEGAFGLSTGLFYAPGSFAKTEEVVELAKVAAAFNGLYDTHMRHQSTYLLDGIRETVQIGKEAGIPVHISHIKADGPAVWGKSNQAIKMIEDARQQGIDVTANIYPYLASRTSLKARLIPRWAEDGGDQAMLKRFDDVTTAQKIRREIKEIIAERGGADKVVLSLPGVDSLHNKSILEIASSWGVPSEEAVIRILRRHTSVKAHSFVMQEYDMHNFLKQPWVMAGSDGDPGGHPRAYGTFPKIIREMVLEKKVLSMAEAIHKATGLTAQTLGLKDRGLIRNGLVADIIVFDPQQIRDKATYEQPDVLASGVEYVLVNGALAINAGEYTGKLAGKAIKKNGNVKEPQ